MGVVSADLEVDLAPVDHLFDELEQRIGHGIYQLGEAAMVLSRLWAPVVTGNLRASGRVDRPRTEGDSIVVELGHDTSYAFSRFMLPQFRARSGRERWLEQAVLQVAQTAEARMQAWLAQP